MWKLETLLVQCNAKTPNQARFIDASTFTRSGQLRNILFKILGTDPDPYGADLEGHHSSWMSSFSIASVLCPPGRLNLFWCPSCGQSNSR